MMRNVIDIIFISKKRNFLRNIRLPSNSVTIIPVVFLVIIISTAILFLYNAREIFGEMNISKSEQQHKILRRKLDSLSTLIDHTHNGFENHIVQDNRERTFWQLAYIHPDIWSMGVGGKRYESPNKFLSDNTKDMLNQVYESIDILKGKCYLREVSLNDIQNQIETKLYLWSHIPSTHPLPGRPLGSGFGYRVDPINKRIKMHWGIDIGAPRGTDILATADGVISYTGWHRGYGLTVDIDHGFGFVTRYAHCHSIFVKKGDLVKRGQVIAIVGSTGRTIASHLHYEVHVSGEKVDPKPYIDLSSVIFD